MPRTRKFKKMFTNNKRVEEEAFINNGTFGLEFVTGKNISSFKECLKTLVYGNTELFTNFVKTIKDSCKGFWNNIVERDFKHDPNNIPGLQTTTNFKIVLEKYQEAFVNKVRLWRVDPALVSRRQVQEGPPSRLCQAHASLEQGL